MPKVNIHFVTTIPTPKVDVLITLYLFINWSTLLVSMNKYVIRMHSTCYKLFIPCSYSWKRYMFYPSAVSVCWLIHQWFMRSIHPKWSGQLWCWYIGNVGFVRFIEVRCKYIILIACDLLFFSQYFFNLIACGFFNCFACVSLLLLLASCLLYWFT